MKWNVLLLSLLISILALSANIVLAETSNNIEPKQLWADLYDATGASYLKQCANIEKKNILIQSLCLAVISNLKIASEVSISLAWDISPIEYEQFYKIDDISVLKFYDIVFDYIKKHEDVKKAKLPVIAISALYNSYPVTKSNLNSIKARVRHK